MDTPKSMDDIPSYKAYKDLRKLSAHTPGWKLDADGLAEIEDGEMHCRYPLSDAGDICRRAYGSDKALGKHVLIYFDKGLQPKKSRGRKGPERMKDLMDFYDKLMKYQDGTINPTADASTSTDDLPAGPNLQPPNQEAPKPEADIASEMARLRQNGGDPYAEELYTRLLNMQRAVDEDRRDLIKRRLQLDKDKLGVLNLQMVLEDQMFELEAREVAFATASKGWTPRKTKQPKMKEAPLSPKKKRKRQMDEAAQRKAALEWQEKVDACFGETFSVKEGSIVPDPPVFDLDCFTTEFNGKPIPKCPGVKVFDACQCDIRRTLSYCTWSSIKAPTKFHPDRWPEAEQPKAREVYAVINEMKEEKSGKGQGYTFDPPKDDPKKKTTNKAGPSGQGEENE